MKTDIAVVHVDDTNDFFPDGGTLAVPDGHAIIKPSNNLTEYGLEKGYKIIFTKDEHPADTPHFKRWPVHSVKDTWGGQLHKDLIIPESASILRKGIGKEDAYSAFNKKAKIEGVDLGTYLRKLGINTLYITGLATDYCVLKTVLDALKQGFNVFLVTDAIRAVNFKEGDGDKAIAKMIAAGAVTTTTEEIISQN